MGSGPLRLLVGWGGVPGGGAGRGGGGGGGGGRRVQARRVKRCGRGVALGTWAAWRRSLPCGVARWVYNLQCQRVFVSK